MEVTLSYSSPVKDTLDFLPIQPSILTDHGSQRTRRRSSPLARKAEKLPAGRHCDRAGCEGS